MAFVDDKRSNVTAAEKLGMAGLLFTDADSVRASLRALGLPV